MTRKYPLHAALYDLSYANDFPENQYYIIIFDEIPSKYSNKFYYDSKVVSYFVKSLGFECVWKSDIMRKSYGRTLARYYVNHEKRILLRIHFLDDKLTGLIYITYFYDLNNGELSDQINFDEINAYKKDKKKSNISLVKSNNGYLDTEEYDIHVPDVNLDLNYGINFAKIHKIIVKRLNSENDKGIILLHGESGTGKTTYLRHLTKFIQDKEILFIPPSMAEMLAEPSIIPFLMEHKNSILIIEDAERVISDRDRNGSTAGVSNILNLTDGILGDCLNIQVIATFNTKREKIDQALLRKGRLIVEHEFTKLSVVESNDLLKFLNKDIITELPLTLADIYNIDVDNNRINQEPKKVGLI